MKINKQKQKECISRIKEIAADLGYRKIQDSIYKIEDENVISVDFLVIDSKYLNYWIRIKKRSYDTIFWKIMRMEDNIGSRDSLRIIGAFVSPTVLIASGRVDLSEDVEMIARDILKTVGKEIDTFLEGNDLVDYIFADKQKADIEILKCLAYIDLNFWDKAKALAQQQILSGDTGRFVNEDKGFFELLMLYNE